MTDSRQVDGPLHRDETVGRDRLASWFDRAAVGIAQIDSRTGGFVAVNPAYARMVGYTRDELEQIDFQRITHPDDLESDLELMEQVIAGEIREFTLEKRYFHKDGHVVWVSLTVAALWSEGDEPDFHLATVEDITLRKRAQAERALVFERISDAFVALDRGWNYVYVNAKAAELFGRTPDSLVGKHIWTEFPEGVGQGFHKAYERAMETQQPETFEEYFEPWDRWYENRLYPSPEGLSIYFHDITERKRAHEKERELERQLAQSQKMESLGRLASGVAHDVNNVLAAILGVATLNSSDGAGSGSMRGAFETIAKACERGREVVQQLLAFSREGLAELVSVDLNRVVREHAELLGHTTLTKIRITTDLAAEVAPVRGDPSALSHVLMNLSVNAMDALGDSGSLTLRTYEDGDDVVLVVEDDGVGMEPEVLRRSFDPFFSTKPPGKGTGLGLALVYATVSAHDGRVDISSEPGRGTRVSLRLPADRSPTKVAARKVDEGDAVSLVGLKVLLVDDDAMVRDVLQLMLVNIGCQVIAAETGERALELLGSAEPPGAIILDVHMPGIGGSATLEAIRSRGSSVPVILSTGNADQDVLDLAETHANVSLLTKPFRLDEIRDRLVAAITAS